MIKITIRKTGLPIVEGVGIQGTACTLATKPYIDKMGVTGEDKVEQIKCDEMYAQGSVEQQTEIQNGGAWS